MSDTALVTMFGDVLIPNGTETPEMGATGPGTPGMGTNGTTDSLTPNTDSPIRGTVLEGTGQTLLGIDPQRRLLLNAPAGWNLLQTAPAVYQLRDASGAVWSHAPDGSRDRVMERASWSELVCLSLRRFPDIAPAQISSEPVPRLLHYICNDLATLDPAITANIERTAQMNPGWSLRLWDEAARFDFISEHYGWDVLKVYLMIGGEYGAAKADFFRYLLIYKLGGVYLDLKSTTSRPLDEMIRADDAYLISQWNMSGSGLHKGWGIGASIAYVQGGEYQQWFLIARPGHPYLRRVIQLVMTKILTYRPEVHGAGAVTTFNITGPHAYTQAIYPIRNAHPHRVFDAESEGLVYSVIEDHRSRSGSNYREARTPIVTGNESYRL